MDNLLPPEQFHIKRRREEEPVDTLYIQSELQQKKRRFTDFVFQRVKISQDFSSRDDDAGDSDVWSRSPQTTAAAAATTTLGGDDATAFKNRLRSPRSVSTSDFARSNRRRPHATPSAAEGPITTIPTIRTTSPGAEFRSARALAQSRRRELELVQQRRREPIDQILGALENKATSTTTQHHEKKESIVATPPPSGTGPIPGELASSNSASLLLSSREDGPASFPKTLRRFHISRPSTPLSPQRGPAGSGVSKKSNAPNRARAILVEKLTQGAAPSVLRGTSVVETLDEPFQAGVTNLEEENPVQRKRHIVNQAEKRWREQQNATIATAKEHLTHEFEGGRGGDLDRLAKDLEQVMLDIEAEEEKKKKQIQRQAAVQDEPMQSVPTASTSSTSVSESRSKRPLKYMPRPSGTRRTVRGESQQCVMETQPHDEMEQDQHDKAIPTEAEERDRDYVYDTYIRVPIDTIPSSTSGATPQSDITGYKDPLAELNTPGGINIDPSRTDIGVVVITADDEDIWDQYLEEDQDSEVDWDGDDVDSNAEDNPANDYPDMELSSTDEFDNGPGIYRRYRTARSDDEEFDADEFDDSLMEGDDDEDAQYRKHMYDYIGDDDEDDRFFISS